MVLNGYQKPNDINTSEEANRYVYFHLLYLGFLDTPSNTAAVAYSALNGSCTGKRVNYYTGTIKAERVADIKAGDELSSDNFKVYEVYSDDANAEITSYSIEGFKSTAGTHAVTITSSRDGATAIVQATVVE